MNCPCGSGRAYAACCGPLHGGRLAQTAEQLMRSRYSAFVLDQRAYLLATWHPRTRPARIEPPEPGLRWLGLTVKAATETTVSFVAVSKRGGRAHRLVETSRFERVDGAWLYVDGDVA